jgi:hypothetical protein
VLLSLKSSDSEGAFIGVVVGKEELGGGRGGDSVKCYNKYLYLLPADLGGAALLGLLKEINNYERGWARG